MLTAGWRNLRRVRSFLKTMNKHLSALRFVAMQTANSSRILLSAAAFILGFSAASAKPKPAASAAPLTETGRKLEVQYASTLAALREEIAGSLPKADEQKNKALREAQESVGKAMVAAEAAQKNLGQIATGKALVGHAKGKWIGGADKGIVAAKAALAKAANASERAAAEKDLAHWEANKAEGEKALAERQAALDVALRNEAQYSKANAAAQADLAKAKDDEAKVAKDLTGSLASVLSSDKLDTQLARAVILTHATPRGLAEFAEKDAGSVAMVEKLLADGKLMNEMLVAGGAHFGKYGRAMGIFSAIQQASQKAATGELRRLALATALEHATPITQSHPKESTGGASTIDPVKRYLHYEKAYLAGELDPAFKNFTAWEYRHVVNCDAPDEILQWGREMLRTYRPDHIYNPDYGWRYVSSVRTEVPYGSQNVHLDKPTLHQYQNIMLNGGVCGRRAFFGRFILRSFGIPTWGVTQKAHAALSHWTPKGWVVNLGAGYGSSWWDKDEVPLSGNQFLLETQARAHADGYLKVLRAQWISRILGEPAYNERRKVAGGFWSDIALQKSRMLASTAATLGPLGQELAEANDREQKVSSAKVSAEDTKITVSPGEINIPAVAHVKTGGKGSAMRSIDGKMQIHALGGFTAEYEVTVPIKGKYLLTARLATVQTGQKLLVSRKGGAQPNPIDVPYTTGMWEPTDAVELDLVQGKNTILVELTADSRGVTIKDFALKPVK